MSGNLSDALALFDAIQAKRIDDERFAETFKQITELLTEASTALAEVSEATTKAAAKPAIDHDELAKALAAAFVVAVRQMPAPVVQAPPAPAASTAPSWSSLDVKTPDGKSYVITRK